MSEKTEKKWYETVKAKATALTAVLACLAASVYAIQKTAEYIGLPAEVAALTVKVDEMAETVDKIWEKVKD